MIFSNKTDLYYSMSYKTKESANLIAKLVSNSTGCYMSTYKDSTGYRFNNRFDPRYVNQGVSNEIQK